MMKKMKFKIILILLVIPVFIVAQELPVYSLYSCYDSAINNYPNYSQLKLNREIYELNQKNISSSYYPSLNINGQASWQSEVTKLPFGNNIPGINIEELDKDWYKLNLDIEQVIYDGGLVSNKKKIETVDLEINNQRLMIEIYHLKQNINALYFNIVYLNKSREILKVLISNLEVKYDQTKKSFENGMLLQSDLDALSVEINTTKQKIIQLNFDIAGLMGSLNELCGLDISEPSQLKLPAVTVESFNFENNRPEYQMYNMQQSKLFALKDLTKVKRRPAFVAFGQMGYGRPGYNMLDNSFTDYYMFGLRLRWNIWDWGKVKREKQVFDIQNNIVNTQKETFEQGLRADLQKKISDISKYQQLIENDREIVRLQENVVKTASSQMDNGTITTTNYLIEVNKKVKSELDLEAHKLQLIFANLQYKTAIGNN
ncbi:MAG: hypothetical protein C0598_11640 [Marinilabiliales bacterium]|nr:MAG: hypothetical protein C0598_11640 [Marinilabiliales bacterium]